ncbi:hypothetical protein PQX77_012178 [Marasmius sp. AFHP31]|nr:hypothetical protein PQX77_012178 [Marasmius sp. AFHP31]
MSSHLENLPTELLATIFGLLPRDGSRLALASTSEHLRGVLAPHVFSAVKLNSSTQERHEFEQLVNKYRPTITRLHFMASMPYGVPEVNILATTDHRIGEQDIASSTDEDPVASADDKNFVTDFARDALTGKLLPKVTTLCLSFNFDFDYDGEKPGEGSNLSTSMWIFTDEEADDDVPVKEAKYPWRALMAQTWLAICQNKFISKLIVLDLIPKKTTAFDSDDWRSFLGCLDTLELGIWGDDSELGLRTLEGCTDFGCKLDRYFFRYLTKVQRLVLVAYPDCPFGGDVGDILGQDVFLDWALSKEHLPHLRILELRNVFVSKKLANFIISRSATLYQVRLHDCHCESSSNFVQAEIISWAIFFTHLDRNKTQLKELCITYEQGSDTAILYEGNLLEEKEEDMVFSYGYMDTECGFMIDDKMIREKNEERMDLIAYQKLMNTIKQNWEGERERLAFAGGPVTRVDTQ